MDIQRKSLRGFASMDKAKQREIASKGGRAANERGTAHEFNTEEAAMAARKGHERGTAHEFTTEEARTAGRKGGMARAAHRAGNGSASNSGAGVGLQEMDASAEGVERESHQWSEGN